MTDLPTGTVTFLFTDIEGSTQLWEKHPEAMQAVLAKHDAILREAIESNHGLYHQNHGRWCPCCFINCP
jgi:class 3 adenylate cyclase